MKYIISILALLFTLVFGLVFLTFKAVADELSPLDFIDQYDNFELRVGMDKGSGKYITYHYEYGK